MTDGAVVNPGAEADLLAAAERESLKNLRDHAARRKAEVIDLEERDTTIRRGRKCRTWVDGDGGWNLSARGPVADGSGFQVDLDAFINTRFNQARTDGHRESRDNYAFDALMDLARPAGSTPPAAAPGVDNTEPGSGATVGRHPGSAAADGGGSTTRDHTGPITAEPDGSGSPGAPADARAGRPQRLAGTGDATNPAGPSAPRRENLRHLAVIRVDLGALVNGCVGDGEVCEIAGLGPVPVSAARRRLGDSILKLVITRGVDVANVTHLGRAPTAAQTVALLWNHPCCTVEGCNRTQRLQIDHRQPWAQKQTTEPGPLIAGCCPSRTGSLAADWVSGSGLAV